MRLGIRVLVLCCTLLAGVVQADEHSHKVVHRANLMRRMLPHL